MTFEKFQKLAGRTDTKRDEPDLYYLVSIIEEFGEFLKPFRKNIWHKKPLPDNIKEHIKDEMGDLLWFLARKLAHDRFIGDIKTEGFKRPLIKIIKSLEQALSFDDNFGMVYNLADFAKTFDLTLDEIYDYNINKLKERHGDKYNESFYTGEKNGN